MIAWTPNCNSIKERAGYKAGEPVSQGTERGTSPQGRPGGGGGEGKDVQKTSQHRAGDEREEDEIR